MKTLKGNLVNIEKGVIVHQVNNKGVMGAGLALAIRNKYPQHYADYKKSKLELGSLIKTPIHKHFGIVGFVSQNGYGRDPNMIYTDYPSFTKCLLELKKLHEKSPKCPIYLPYNIGCGLANGDWNIIEQLIEKHCPFVTIISLD